MGTAALIGSAVIGAAGSAYAGSQAKKGAEKASDAQVQAQREAIRAQQQAFQQAAPGLAQFLSPYRQQAFAPALSLGETGPGGQFLGGMPQQPAVDTSQLQAPAPPRTFGGRLGQLKTQQDLERYQREMAEYQQQMAQLTSTAPAAPGDEMASIQPAPAVPGMGDLTGGAQYDPLTQIRAASGALGPEAQAAFYESFQEDPGTQFLREQGLRDINRQASATGGLGGASRMKAMTQFSQGLANQQLQQRLAQLGGLAQTDIGLATGLANLRTGLGSAQAQGLSNIGTATAQGAQAAAQAQQGMTQGIAGGISQLLPLLAQQGGGTATPAPQSPQGAPFTGGIGTSYGYFSDDRLKTNLQKVGEQYGLNIYHWDWTDEAKHMVGDQPTVGFIASEVQEKYPEAVFEDSQGYRRVDYLKIGRLNHGS